MLLTSHDDDARPDLVARVDETFPYHFSTAYAAFLRETLGRRMRLLFREDGSAAVPLLLDTRGAGLRLGRLLDHPFGPSGRLSPDAEAAFLEEAVAFLREEGCHRLAGTPRHAVFRAHPRGATACPWGTYFIPLRGRTEDDVFQGFRKNYRNEIRSAPRRGAETRYGPELVEPFYALYVETMERVEGPPRSLAHFETLLRCSTPARATCGMVYVDGKPAGGAIWAHTRWATYYLFGCSAADAGVSGAVKLLQWEMIRRSLAEGIGRYDFAGVRLTDPRQNPEARIQDFKRRFGAETEAGWMWKMDLAPGRCALYDRLVGLRQRLSGAPAGPDLIDEERAKPVAGEADARPGTRVGAR